jgi:carbamoyl-phosphate synthase large subunit
VLVPEPETIERCADKYLAHRLFEEQGIGTPPTWLPTEVPETIRFPVLVKARKGFGSRHIYRADNQTELDFFLRYTTADSMVQSVCHGEEFSIDVFCDLEGRCLGAVPRTMIESKGGESIKGMTIRDPDLIEFGVRVSETLRIIGPANVQCFREPDGELQVTDVNPRFGGGFPLPTAAGSRYPELALALANGEQPEQRLGEFREGVVMTRFFSQVILEERDGSLQPSDAEAVPEEA